MLSLNVVLVLLVLICTATDLTAGKIYNCVTVPSLMAGICLRLAYSGVQALPLILFSALLPLILLYPVWILTGGSGIGGGDIKLLSAVSACLHADQMLIVALVSFATAAGYGILRALGQRRRHCTKVTFVLCADEKDMECDTGIHLAFFIALGVLLHIGGLY